MIIKSNIGTSGFVRAHSTVFMFRVSKSLLNILCAFFPIPDFPREFSMGGIVSF